MIKMIDGEWKYASATLNSTKLTLNECPYLYAKMKNNFQFSGTCINYMV